MGASSEDIWDEDGLKRKVLPNRLGRTREHADLLGISQTTKHP